MFRAVQGDGSLGAELGRVTRTGRAIEATPGVAEDTVKTLAGRFAMTSEQVFDNLVERGWSNGQVAVEVPAGS